jgi:hypothetical protein
LLVLAVNDKEKIIEKLRRYKREDVVITGHAWEAILWRDTTIAEVKENIINPVRLAYAIRQKSSNPNETKYECFFDYGEMQCHRYIIVLNHDCTVCTVMNIRRRWRHIAEKHAKTEV